MKGGNLKFNKKLANKQVQVVGPTGDKNKDKESCSKEYKKVQHETNVVSSGKKTVGPSSGEKEVGSSSSKNVRKNAGGASLLQHTTKKNKRTTPIAMIREAQITSLCEAIGGVKKFMGVPKFQKKKQ